MGAIRSAARSHPDLWLFLLVLAILGPFVQEYTAQPASRYVLSAAIWEHHTVNVAGYPLGIDRAVLPNGEIRSDKAPGQPLLAVPAYAVGRVFGVEPGSHARYDHNLGLWWITLWSTVVPLGLLAVLLRRVAVGLNAPAPTLAALIIVFGSTIADVSTELFAHVLAGLFVFGAWYVLRGAARDRRAPWFVGGVLVGSAIVTEYTTILLGAVMAGFVLWKAREKFGWFILGGVPAGIVAMVYDQLAFGSPFKVGYATKHPHAGGFFGIGVPHLNVLARIFFDQKGLFLLTPVVILALVLAYLQAREPGPARVDAIVALLCFGMMLIVQSGWPNPWGGEYAGPRYMIPALPFLAIPLAVGWNKWRNVSIAVSAWSVGVMSLAYITYGLVPTDGPALKLWFQRIGDHVFTPTIWTMGFGAFGTALHIVIAGLVGYALWLSTGAVGSRRAAQTTNQIANATTT